MLTFRFGFRFDQNTVLPLSSYCACAIKEFTLAIIHSPSELADII